MLISSTREHNSQGGREYRKGKQERKVTPGNRIKGTDFNSQLNDIWGNLWYTVSRKQRVWRKEDEAGGKKGTGRHGLSAYECTSGENPQEVCGSEEVP